MSPRYPRQSVLSVSRLCGVLSRRPEPLALAPLDAFGVVVRQTRTALPTPRLSDLTGSRREAATVACHGRVDGCGRAVSTVGPTSVPRSLFSRASSSLGPIARGPASSVGFSQLCGRGSCAGNLSKKKKRIMRWPTNL